MKVDRNSVHSTGPTFVVFSKDGREAYTGGADSLVRIWDMSLGENQEGVTISDVSGAISALSITDDYLFVGSVEGNVLQYVCKTPQDHIAQPFAQSDGMFSQSLAMDSKGKYLAIASKSERVSIVDIENDSEIRTVEQKGVRKLTWHPNLPLLTCCDTEGHVYIWDLSEKESKVVYKFQNLIPKSREDIDQDDCSAVWHPSGDYFFVITAGHDIVTIDRSKWKQNATYKDAKVSENITALAVSRNGLYLASVGQSKVYIWSTQNKRVHSEYSISIPAVQLSWSPRENLVAWTNINGQFLRWHGPVDPAYPDPVTVQSVLTEPEVPASKPISALTDIYADDDTENPDFSVDNADRKNISKAPTTMEAAEDDDDDDVDSIREMVNITRAQPPFQPGSTPLQNKRCYLAYNTLGAIESTENDEHHIINVEFFDQSARQGFHFSTHANYEMGYLGERGAIFASQPDQNTPARIEYRYYGSWSANRQWVHTLRPDVKVLGIAAGGVPPTKSLRRNENDLEGYGNVVIATSESDLTFLSGTGRERRILGLGGDFVSMVAGPDWVFVVYRDGSTTMDGSQNLRYIMINFEDFGARQTGVLPVPKRAILTWIGITDQGAPAMYDSVEQLHILTKYRVPHHATWSRVFNAKFAERREGRQESYWPIGVIGNSLHCVILKGLQEYPGFPRPFPQEIPLKIPFVSKDAKEEQVERELLFNDMALDLLDEELTTHDIISRERAIDKEFIQLIQGACKADNTPRAIELTKLLHHPQSFDMAIRVADFYHMVGLKEKMTVLKNLKEVEDDRLERARAKRRRWNKVDTPIRSLPDVDMQPSVSKEKVFQDFGPPPVIPRPGLSRATPAVERSHFKAGNVQVPAPEEAIYAESLSAESSPGIKRKRDDASSAPSTQFDLPPPLPQKQKSNPFARKPNQENKLNPFGKPVESSKTIQKSESFFNKVDAATDGVTNKSKRLFGKNNKNKKETGPKQTTLFGLIAPKDKQEKHSETSQGSASISDSDTVTLVPGTQETQVEETQDTQIDDMEPEETQLDPDSSAMMVDI